MVRKNDRTTKLSFWMLSRCDKWSRFRPVAYEEEGKKIQKNKASHVSGVRP